MTKRGLSFIIKIVSFAISSLSELEETLEGERLSTKTKAEKTAMKKVPPKKTVLAFKRFFQLRKRKAKSPIPSHKKALREAEIRRNPEEKKITEARNSFSLLVLLVR